MVLHGVCRSHGDLSLPEMRETYRLAPSVETPASNKVWGNLNEDTNSNENRIIQMLIILSNKSFQFFFTLSVNYLQAKSVHANLIL